jgi:hypothetical protein
MSRPRTILGLVVALIRARGLTRVEVATAVMIATLASSALLFRARQSAVTVDALADREVSSWRHAPADSAVALDDATVIATPTGWLVAWTRWERAHGNAIQVAALDRAGTLRGAPITLSPREFTSRHPHLARGPRGNAVVWASSPADSFEPHAWFTVVDDDARVTVTPRRLGAADDESLDAQAAWDGEGWGVGWSRFRPAWGFTLVRLSADGSPRGESTQLVDTRAGFRSSLVWNGSAWLVVQSTYRPRADASAVRLTWIERYGRPVVRRELSRSHGEIGDIVATTRGTSAWVIWGEDMGFGVRHDPRIARVDDRIIAQPPRPLGPRRSGSVPAIACSGDGCTLAWTEVPDGGTEPAFYVQRVDLDGAPRSTPRRVGAEGHAWPRFAATIATSLDDQEALAVWPAAHVDRSGLLLVRLDSNGVPVGPPRELLP